MDEMTILQSQACSSPGVRPVATVIKMDVLELKGDLLDGKTRWCISLTPNYTGVISFCL